MVKYGQRVRISEMLKPIVSKRLTCIKNHYVNVVRLELTKKLDWIISMLTKDSPTKRTYESLHMFSTKKDSIEFVYEWFRKYHVVRDNIN